VAKAVEEWGHDMQATAAGTELLREETVDGSAHATAVPPRISKPRRPLAYTKSIVVNG
jgi:hypothetical protein